MAPSLPWYRRPLSGRQHAVLLFSALLLAGGTWWLAFREARFGGPPNGVAGDIAFSLLPCAACWPLFYARPRWAPWLGFGVVVACGALLLRSEPRALGLVAVAALFALFVAPRPHRGALRVVAVAISVLAACWPLLSR